jgi:hypothetical protein
MVGAGAGGAPTWAVGGRGTAGAGGGVAGAEATAGGGAIGAAGASAAFRVTRTVSFFNGTLDVCLDGVGGRFSESLMAGKEGAGKEGAAKEGRLPG